MVNFFEKSALDFIYCTTYIPEIDDKLNGREFMVAKSRFVSPFDIIIIPIGLWLLYRKSKRK